MPKVARPLGGSLDLAFHFSIPPPAFKAQSPPQNSETLKPASTRCGRQDQPVYVCLQGTDVHLSNCTEQTGAGKQALQQEGPSGAQGHTSHLP